MEKRRRMEERMMRGAGRMLETGGIHIVVSFAGVLEIVEIDPGLFVFLSEIPRGQFSDKLILCL